MQKKVFVRRSSKTALKKQYIPIFYSSAALICTIILCIQSFTGGKNDIFFELLSFKMPFIYGMSDIEDVENDASLSNRSSASDDLVIELLGKSDIKNLTAKSNSEPTILIYHTHTTEAYTQTDGYEYEETTQWRTDDTDKSIVAVGEKLCTLLREKYGLCVIHDTTDHEPPKLSTSYSRSVKTMEEYKEKYPSLVMFIDVHRDAYGSGDDGLDDVATIDGKECAKLMFVVGTGKGATGNGFDEMPDFESNYALAETITNTLNEFDDALTRKIRVKSGRYNQHISDSCLLVEVGHNANSLEQALNSVDYLAAAIASAALSPSSRQLDFSA